MYKYKDSGDRYQPKPPEKKISKIDLLSFPYEFGGKVEMKSSQNLIYE